MLAGPTKAEGSLCFNLLQTTARKFSFSDSEKLQDDNMKVSTKDSDKHHSEEEPYLRRSTETSCVK